MSEKYISITDAVHGCCRVLHNMGKCHLGVLCPDFGCREVREVFEAITAADVVERKTGKWIPVKEETGVEAFGFKEMAVDAFRCSACGKEIDVSEGGFKFCPHCGAKMIGGDDDV